MDRLWAPWRIKYVATKKEKRCIFCKAASYRGKNSVVFKTKYSICILNIFPYNNGHLLVSPLRHARELCDLKENEILDLFRALVRAQKLLGMVLKPHGYNIGLNLGKSAGSGITGHLHLHIVPRWQGDANFMSAIYDTKVISQSLAQLYKRLKNAYAKTN